MFPHQKLDWTIHRLEKRLDDSPDDVASRLEMASACLSKALWHDGGEVWLNQALTQARRVLQHDPGSPGALVVAGLSLVELGRTDPATRYLDQATGIANERPEVHLALSRLHRAEGDRHQAVRAAEAACRLAPDSWEANAELGKLLFERAHELGASKRLLERSQYHIVRALQLGPSPTVEARLLHDLGVACLRMGRVADAHKTFTRLLDHEDWVARARWYLGLCSYHLGKYKNAILYLRQHLETHPEAAAVHARIGMCYLHLDEVRRAREACNHALALEPEHLQARWTLGCALLEEGEMDEAVRLFRGILEDAPDHTAAFTELVRVRGEDTRWLVKALRSEVARYDRLPVRARRPDGRGMVNPRAGTRDRIQILLRSLSELGEAPVQGILQAMDLTTDEGMRFKLWEAALDVVSSARAREATERLSEPGAAYGAEAGREILALASVIPEAMLTRGLQISEEDLRKAAVERHGPTGDVQAHRRRIDAERQEARAWQAYLLLAIASRNTRSGRNLLLRWASEADPELADAARAALVMLGDGDAAEALRIRAAAKGGQHLVDALMNQVTPPEARFHPRPVSDDEELHCTTCGRRSTEVDHMMAGGEAVVCDHCMMQVARERRDLVTEDPGVGCALCGQTSLEARAVYVWQGVATCADCLDASLGLLEREEVDRYLASV